LSMSDGVILKVTRYFYIFLKNNAIKCSPFND